MTSHRPAGRVLALTGVPLAEEQMEIENAWCVKSDNTGGMKNESTFGVYMYVENRQ